MRITNSTIKLAGFNHCLGAEAIQADLRKYKLLPSIQVVDFNRSHLSIYINHSDTLVVAIRKGPGQMQTALALGNIAARFSADEFNWTVIDGTYIVRLWWD